MILTAAYLFNRVPTFLFRDRSPFEVLYNKLPSYTNLRAFGWLCYTSTLLSSRNKLTHIARACVLLGYHTGIKAYKLLDIETNKVFVSRDVVFHEKIYPLLNSSPPAANVYNLFHEKKIPLPCDDFEGSSLPKSFDVSLTDCEF